MSSWFFLGDIILYSLCVYLPTVYVVKLTDWCTDFVCYNGWLLCPNSLVLFFPLCFFGWLTFVSSFCPSAWTVFISIHAQEVWRNLIKMSEMILLFKSSSLDQPHQKHLSLEFISLQLNTRNLLWWEIRRFQSLLHHCLFSHQWKYFFNYISTTVFYFLWYYFRLHVLNVVCVCLYEIGVSEAWTSRSCKCDCEGGESPTEFSSIGTGSSMVRGVDCMPG